MATRFILGGISGLINRLDIATGEVSGAFENIRRGFALEAEGIIKEVLIQAAAQEGPESFPPAYIEPMILSSSRIVGTDVTSVNINFDLMGTWDDFTRGYHEGARLAGGGTVSIPWSAGTDDSGLKNSVIDRYEFWLAMFHGDRYQNIETAGLYDETIAKRLEVWGELAPQWLLLEYGQEEWEPYTKAYPIVETIVAELSDLFNTTLQSEIEAIISKTSGRYIHTENILDIVGSTNYTQTKL